MANSHRKYVIANTYVCNRLFFYLYTVLKSKYLLQLKQLFAILIKYLYTYLKFILILFMK